MNDLDWRLAAPVLCLLGAAGAGIAFDRLRRPGGRRDPVAWLAYAGILSALFFLYIGTWDGSLAFGRSLVADGLGRFISLAVLLSTGLAVLVSAAPMMFRRIPIGEYVGLVLVAAAGMLLLVLGHDLITLFLAVEILSLSLYILCGITRTDPRANESAMKYFVLGGFGSALMLYGMALLYGATGSVFLDRMVLQGSAHPSLAAAGFGLLLAGFAFKVGAAPFHLWVPDVYEGAPTAVTAFMSVTVKAAGFGALVRILLELAPSDPGTWTALLGILAAATMVLGNLGALGQTSVKRMLAYSSVAHTGYALVGLTAFESVSGPAAAIFYTLAYSVMTLGAFLFLQHAAKATGPEGQIREMETYDDLAGLASRRPWMAGLMAVFMVSLAGLPPTAGFFGKFLLFQAAVEAGQSWLAVVGVLASVVSVAYYVRVIVAMYMREPSGAPEEAELRTDFNVGSALFVTAGLTVFLGLYPTQFVALSQEAIRTLRSTKATEASGAIQPTVRLEIRDTVPFVDTKATK